MSREIKFRVWDVSGNQFWDDSLGDWKIEFRSGKEPTLIVLEETFSPYGEQEFYWRDVENTVFQQYTGLKDKNGKEIYEGDIVKWKHETSDEFIMSEVKWFGNQRYPAFDLQPNDDCEMNALALIFQSGEYEIEVAGNVFENPKLPEEKHE